MSVFEVMDRDAWPLDQSMHHRMMLQISTSHCGMRFLTRMVTHVLCTQGSMWGKVYICESGYRAEYAYPKTIFIRDFGTKVIRRLRDELEERYGVPVFLVIEREGKFAEDIIADQLEAFMIGSTTKTEGGE